MKMDSNIENAKLNKHNVRPTPPQKKKQNKTVTSTDSKSGLAMLLYEVVEGHKLLPANWQRAGYVMARDIIARTNQ